MFQNKNKPTMNELINWFQVNYTELADDMHDSMHSVQTNEPNPFHTENSVLTHTMLVCQRAEIESEKHYSKINLIAALLHDIGKPIAREVIPFNKPKPVHTESNEIKNAANSKEVKKIPKSGLKTHFRGHEGFSFYMAIDILNNLEKEGVVSQKEKEDILKIVSMHGSLFDNLKDGLEYKPEKVVAKFGDDLELYKMFVQQVKNDSLGRFHMSKDGRKDSAYELGNTVYNEDTFKKHYKTPKTNEFKAVITLLVGPPGVGKSTFREKLIRNDSSVITISRDDIFMKLAKEINPNFTYSEAWRYFEQNDLHKSVDAKEQEIFKKAVKERKNIIVDRTNMSAKSRRKWLANIPAKDYLKVAVVILTDYNVIMDRAHDRIDEGSKAISKGLIKNMIKSFMVPNYSEFNIINFV